jgi:hypothetical protein
MKLHDVFLRIRRKDIGAARVESPQLLIESSNAEQAQFNPDNPSKFIEASCIARTACIDEFK